MIATNCKCLSFSHRSWLRCATVNSSFELIFVWSRSVILRDSALCFVSHICQGVLDTRSGSRKAVSVRPRATEVDQRLLFLSWLQNSTRLLTDAKKLSRTRVHVSMSSGVYRHGRRGYTRACYTRVCPKFTYDMR